MARLLGCSREESPVPTLLRRAAKGPGGPALGPRPDKVGVGQEVRWAQGRWGQDSGLAPPVGTPGASSCWLWTLPCFWTSAPDSSAPLAGKILQPQTQYLLGSRWARPAVLPPPPGPGCEPQDLTYNRYPENVCGTELGPASVFPVCTSGLCHALSLAMCQAHC